VQEREAEHLWMRGVGYRWLPLVGRCPGEWLPNDKAVETRLAKNARKAKGG